jgi:hypothetical protein
VAVLSVAVQIGGSVGHGAPPLRHVDLVSSWRMLVEELVVEASNGGNFVIQAAVHRRDPVGKWPSRLRADMNERSPEPPTDGGEVDGRRRRGGGGLGKRWNKGQLAVGV